MKAYSLVLGHSLSGEEGYKIPLTSELAGGQLWWHDFCKALPACGGQRP